MNILEIMQFNQRGDFMYNDGYEKELKIVDKTYQEKELELMTSIIKVKQELDVACSNFEYANRRFNRLLYLSDKSN